MPADNIISRTDVAAVMPEDVATEILGNVPEQSAALRFLKQRRLSKAQQRIPVKSVLPTAYFVSGDTGMKQTTEVNWDNKFLDVEEIACIVPVPENVLDDLDFDLWSEIRPDIEEAIGRTLDAAVFFGLGKPASWPAAIVPQAIAAGNTFERGTTGAGAGGIAEDVSQVMNLVEADGYDTNGFVTQRSFRGRLRSARATDGQKLLDVSANELEGQAIQYAMPGLWPQATGSAELIAGDFAQGILGVRADIDYKLLTEAVIQDPVTGEIVYNLPQQDMIAMRVKARFAYQVPNPINRENADDGTRYPFAVMTKPA